MVNVAFIVVMYLAFQKLVSRHATTESKETNNLNEHHTGASHG